MSEAETIMYRVAVPDDLASISLVFEEVAPEVPTAMRSGTTGLIEELIESNLSWVAVDANGSVVAYALAKAQSAETLSLYYLGVSKSARGSGVSSSLVAKLKEAYEAPIVTDVRHDNKSSMVARFKKWGFVETRRSDEQTHLQWNPTGLPGAADGLGSL